MQAPFYLAAFFLVKSLKSRLFNYDASTDVGTDADASSNNFGMPASASAKISKFYKVFFYQRFD